MERTELYRMLIADHLELLDGAEQSRIERALQEHPDVDRPQLAARLRAALGESDNPEREATFLDAVARTPVGEAPGHRAPRRPARERGSGWWRLGLAAAAGAAAVWLGGQAFRLPSGTEAPATLPARLPPASEATATQVLFLDAERAMSGATIDFDASPAPHVTLVGEARLTDSSARWELRSVREDVLAAGAVAFAREEGRLRTVAVQVPKSLLPRGSSYWLVLRTDAGAEVQRWSFVVR